MNKIIEKTKQTIRKYTLPALLAGSLAFSGCQERKTKTYQIGESEVEFKEEIPKFNTTTHGSRKIIIEKNDSGTIRYWAKDISTDREITRIDFRDRPRRAYDIHNETSKDSIIIHLAQQKANYLFTAKDLLNDLEEKREEKREKREIQKALLELYPSYSQVKGESKIDSIYKTQIDSLENTYQFKLDSLKNTYQVTFSKLENKLK